MTTCPSKGDLYAFIEGTQKSEDKERIRIHLNSCDACCKHVQEVQSIQAMLLNRKRPTPEKALLNIYRDNLKQEFRSITTVDRLKETIKTVNTFVFDTRPLSVRIAKAAALLVVGVLIGRLIFQPIHRPVPDSSKPSIVLLSMTPADIKFMTDFCTQSEIWLLAIVNMPKTEETDPSDLQFNREIAQRLLLKTSIIGDKIQHIQNEPYTKFFNRVEQLLLEAANASDDRIQEVSENIKQTIESSALLYETQHVREMFETFSKGT
jgi:ElaB/YqjD/DUF883 family membrane-anchored ribosome-binding protein